MRMEEEEKNWTRDPVIAEEMRQQSSRAREEWLLCLKREEDKEEERWRQEKLKRGSAARIQRLRSCRRQAPHPVPDPVPGVLVDAPGPLIMIGYKIICIPNQQTRAEVQINLRLEFDNDPDKRMVYMIDAELAATSTRSRHMIVQVIYKDEMVFDQNKLQKAFDFGGKIT
ncbi:unnamed protein product, partial [Didymodactylos carnosus]